MQPKLVINTMELCELEFCRENKCMLYTGKQVRLTYNALVTNVTLLMKINVINLKNVLLSNSFKCELMVELNLPHISHT